MRANRIPLPILASEPSAGGGLSHRTQTQVPGAAHLLRSDRAYGDFRAYSEVGGGREALTDRGAAWGTQDVDIAERLFAKRLGELQEKRRGRAGVNNRSTTLAPLNIPSFPS